MPPSVPISPYARYQRSVAYFCQIEQAASRNYTPSVSCANEFMLAEIKELDNKSDIQMFCPCYIEM